MGKNRVTLILEIEGETIYDSIETGLRTALSAFGPGAISGVLTEPQDGPPDDDRVAGLVSLMQEIADQDPDVVDTMVGVLMNDGDGNYTVKVNGEEIVPPQPPRFVKYEP
jgi:hypothetical protein